MKRIFFSALGLLLTLLAPEAGAAVQFWDNNGTAAATSGTWDTTTPNWAPTTSLTASTLVWNSANAAGFCAGTSTTGTVNIALNSILTCPGLFNGNPASVGCVLTVSGTGAINLPAALAGFGTANGGTTTIAVPIIGPGTVVAEGDGPIFLHATNTQTGGTYLGGHTSRNFTGTLSFNNPYVFGTGALLFSNCNGGTLELEGTNAMTITNSVATSNATVNIIANPAGLTFSGPWSLGNFSLIIGANGNGNFSKNRTILSGVIGGVGGSLGKYKPGTLVLTGNNTYTGGTTVSNGILLVANSAGSATGTGSVTVTNFNGAFGKLNGSGTVSGAVALYGSIGATNMAGGPATLTTGPVTVFGGAQYQWLINNATANEGGSSGWGLLSVNGALTNLATAGSPWNIDLVSLTAGNAPGALAGFNNAQDYRWRILHTTAAALNNFDPNTISLTKDSFASALGTGNFYLSTNGTPNDIYLNFLHRPAVSAVSANQSVAATGTAVISVSSPGTVLTSQVTYQWQHGGTNLSDDGRISGSSSATLTINNVADADTGSYTVVLANTAGSLTSGSSVLTVVDPPVISSVSAVVSNMTNVVFNAAVGPVTALNGATYRWSANGNPLSDSAHVIGSATTSLTIVHAAPADAGTYTLVMTNLAGKATNSAILDAPGIASATGNQTVATGTTVFFGVTVSHGTSPVTYQWQAGGVNLSDGAGITGSSTASLTVVATDATAGAYDVVVSNPGGQAVSVPAVLTVVDPPIISSITPAVTNVTNVVFNAVVNPVTATVGAVYQWSMGGTNLFDDVHIIGSATTNLTIVNATAADLGAYILVVTNIAGQAINAGVFTAPVITSATSNQTVLAGTPVLFTVTLSQGTTPVRYQWRVDGIDLSDSPDISGSSTATLTVNASDATAGAYDVVVSNPGGQDTSFPATLTVHDPAVITSQPLGQSVECGTTVTFTTSASGDAPLHYQWYFGAAAIAGGTNSSLTLSPASVADSGSYQVVVTNLSGTSTGQVAMLSVTDTRPPVLTLNGPAVTNIVLHAAFHDPGATATDICSGDLPVTILGTVDANSPGSYTLTYRATDTSGNSSSATRMVNVVRKPTIIAEPMSIARNIGGTATFSVAAVGAPTLAYQWYAVRSSFNLLLIGKTAATLSLPVLSTNQASGYFAIVSNGYGKATSVVARLTISVTPAIKTQPLTLQKTIMGNTVSFSVNATGSAPLSYQWNFDSAPIPNATEASYHLTNVQTADSGTYTVTVSNPSGVPITSLNSHGVLIVQPDIVAPVLTIHTPKAAALFTNSHVYGGVTAPDFTLAGSVTDNGLITNVTIQRIAPVVDAPVNATLFGPATGVKTFTNVCTLADGTNVYQIYAIDSAGNKSAIKTISAFLYNASTLTILTNGTGRVSSLTGATNQARLPIGRAFTVIASEATGVNWVLTNWSSGPDIGQLVPISTNVTLTFTMTSNLVLQANFVPNPFTAAAGSYNGLFYPGDGVTEESSGLFNVTIASASKGAYTGRIYLDGTNHSLSGTFNLDGDASAVIDRSNKTPVTVNLHIDLHPFDNRITGSVSDGNWASALTGEVSLFNGTTVKATDYAARYTLSMAASNHLPAGFGFAMITNNLAGKSTLSGSLGDGSVFNQSVPISQMGNVPFYVSLYSGKGLILGWLTFTNMPSKTIFGTLSWIKPAVNKTVYPLGFDTTAVAQGAEYVAPTSGTRILQLTNGVLTLDDGNLTEPLVFNVGLSTANLLTKSAGSPTNKLSVIFTPATGAMKITFQPTGSKTQTVGQGVVLQGSTNAAGWFLGTNASGSFFLQ